MTLVRRLETASQKTSDEVPNGWQPLLNRITSELPVTRAQSPRLADERWRNWRLRQNETEHFV
jgi:hypothetical protein